MRLVRRHTVKRSLFGRGKLNLVLALIGGLAVGGQIDEDEAIRRLSGTGCLQNADVRREIGLTNWQNTRITSVLSRHARAMTAGVKPGGVDPAEQIKQAYESTEGVLVALTPAQKTRLREIGFQMGGPQMIANPLLRKELGITDEQRKKFDEIDQWYRDQLQPIMKVRSELHTTHPDSHAFMAKQKETGLEMMKKHREAAVKMFAVFTAEQRKKWASFIGKPYQPAGSPIPPLGALPSPQERTRG
jgi:hypothetical protein